MTLAAAVMLAFGASQAPAAVPSTTCTGQDVAITAENAPAAERSLHCLINVYRADNGRGGLTRDDSLRLAARRHSEDMIGRAYFSHDAPAPSPFGADHEARASAAGYPADTDSTGENLGAEFPQGTAFGLFEQWRWSPSHNENMLDPEWTTSGFGIIRGWPGDDEDGATFEQGATATGLFGAKDRDGSDSALELVGGDPNTIPGPGPDVSGGDGDGDGGGDDQRPDCGEAKSALQKAKSSPAKAKEARKKAQARKRAARGSFARRKAARKLRGARKAERKAKRVTKQARNRYLACLEGL